MEPESLATPLPETVFEAEGGKTGADSMLVMALVLIGVIGSVSLTIVAFTVPGHVGSPLIYIGTLALAIALGVWLFRKDAVRIRITKAGDDLRVRIDGPTTKVDEQIPPTAATDHWVSFEKMPIRMGGGSLVRYSVVTHAASGRRLGFTLRAGEQGTEPADWPQRDDALEDGPDVFHCPGITALVAALRGERAGPPPST